MKKLIVLGLIIVLVGTAFAIDRKMVATTGRAVFDHQIVQQALDSNGVDYANEIQAVVDTALPFVVTARMGGWSATGVYDTLVAAETLKTVLFACPLSGVTSVTVKNIDFVAKAGPNIVGTGTKVAWASVKNMDATDSTMKNVVIKKTLDSVAVALLTAYRPQAITIDSSANAVLYPGDILWGFICADTLCSTIREFNAVLSLSVDK